MIFEFFLILFVIHSSAAASSQQCERLPDLENIVMECDEGAPSVGSKCTFSCRTPYQLTGSNERWCNSSLEWTGDPAQCEAPSESPQADLCKPDQSQWIEGNTNYRALKYKADIYAYAICKVGFAIGSLTKVRCVDGRWEKPLPQCNRISSKQCEPLTITEFLVKNCDERAPYEGAKCTFRCIPPFQITGSHERTCNSNLQWTGIQPQCKALSGIRRKNDSVRIENSERKNEDPEPSNPCDKNNGGCDHSCSFLSGEIQCSCRSGYSLSPTNGRSCLANPPRRNPHVIHSYSQKANVNQCDKNNGGCDHICQYQSGSIICSCHPGYMLETYNNRSCTEIERNPSSSVSHSHRNTVSTYNTTHATPLPSRNPCEWNNGGCGQICKLNGVSIVCSCHPGYLLQPDGSCVDIDECPDPTQNQCSHKCHNIQGGYECSCEPGYTIRNRFYCQDVDECRNKDRNLCNQNCHNTKGSYNCSCNAGYILKNKFECEGCRKNSYRSDLDASCRECPPDSVTDSEAKTSIADCLCAPGYVGDPYHLIPCEDIDECMADNFGCSHTCVNTPGGAHCSCDLGFQLLEDDKTCVDVDECNTKNGGCQKFCKNTVGSYNCYCSNGYILSEDGYACEDVNECSVNNGGCSQICINFNGGFYCSCPDGYRLDVEGKTCIAVRCLAVAVPHHSSMRCFSKKDRKNKVISKPHDELSGSPSDYPFDTICRFICNKGYSLTSTDAIECINSGSWNTSTPECRVSRCPPLVVPDNGDVYPPTCTEGSISVQQKCYFTCNTGYHLVGKPVFKCKNNLSWTVNTLPSCIPDEISPSISCPDDITIELIWSESWANVIVLPPTTNMKDFQVFPDWVSVGNSTLFPSGTTDILFKVSNNVNNASAQCVMTVNVVDKEPPVFLECPESITVDGVGSPGTPVNWEEPLAVDNVGIQVVSTNLEPNTILTTGIHHVQYIAKDKAGNVAQCSFKINVTRGHCTDLQDPENGIANCMDWMLGKLCRPSCESGYNRDPNEPKFFACSDSGMWTPKDIISPCLMECLNGTVWSPTSESCEEADGATNFATPIGEFQIHTEKP